MTTDNILKNNSGVAKSFNTILDDTDLKIPERIKSILLALKNDTIFQQKNLSVLESKEIIKNLIEQKEVLIQTKRNAISTILESNANGQERLKFIKSTNLEIDELNEQIIFFKQVENFLIQSLNQYENLFLKQAIDKYVQEQNNLRQRQREQEEYNEYAIDIAKSVLDDIEDVNTWLLKLKEINKLEGSKTVSNREPSNVQKVKTVNSKSKEKRQSSESLKKLKSKVLKQQLENKLKSNSEIPRATSSTSVDKSKNVADQNSEQNNPKEKEQIKTESKPIFVTLIQDPEFSKSNKNEDLEKALLDLEKQEERLRKENKDLTSEYFNLFIDKIESFLKNDWRLNTSFSNSEKESNKFSLIFDHLINKNKLNTGNQFEGIGSLLYFICFGNNLFNVKKSNSIFNFFEKEFELQKFSLSYTGVDGDSEIKTQLPLLIASLNQKVKYGIGGKVFITDVNNPLYLNPAYTIYKFMIESNFSFELFENYRSLFLSRLAGFNVENESSNFLNFETNLNNITKVIVSVYESNPWWKQKLSSFFYFDLTQDEIYLYSNNISKIEYNVVLLKDNSSLNLPSCRATPFSFTSINEKYNISKAWILKNNAEDQYINPLQFLYNFIETINILIKPNIDQKEIQEKVISFFSYLEDNFFVNNLSYHPSVYNIDINQEVNTEVYSEYIFNSLGLMNQTINTVSFGDNPESLFFKNEIVNYKCLIKNEVIDLLTLCNIYLFEANLSNFLTQKENNFLNEELLKDLLEEFKTENSFFDLLRSDNIKNNVNIVFDGQKFKQKITEINNWKEEPFTKKCLENWNSNNIYAKKYYINIDHRHGKINDRILEIYFVWRILLSKKETRIYENVAYIEDELFSILLNFETKIMESLSVYNAIYNTKVAGFFDNIKQYDPQEVPVDGVEGNAEWCSNFLTNGTSFLDFIYLETGFQSSLNFQISSITKNVKILKYNWKNIFTSVNSSYDFIGFPSEDIEHFVEPPAFIINENLPLISEFELDKNYQLAGWRDSSTNISKQEYTRAKYLYENKYDIDSILNNGPNYFSFYGNAEIFQQNNYYDFLDRRHSFYYQLSYRSNQIVYSGSYKLSQKIKANKLGLKYIDPDDLFSDLSFLFTRLNGEDFAINDFNELFSFIKKVKTEIETQGFAPDTSYLEQPKMFYLEREAPGSDIILGGFNYNFSANEAFKVYLYKHIEALSYGLPTFCREKDLMEDWFMSYVCRFKLFFTSKIDWEYIFSVDDFKHEKKTDLFYLLNLIFECNYGDAFNFALNLELIESPDFQADSNLYKNLQVVKSMAISLWFDFILKRKDFVFLIEDNKSFKIHSESEKKKINSIMSFFDISFYHSYFSKHIYFPFVFTNTDTNDRLGAEYNYFFKSKLKITEDEKENAVLSYCDIGWCNFSERMTTIKITDYKRSIYYNSYGNLFDKDGANTYFRRLFFISNDLISKGIFSFNINFFKPRNES